ncbi:DUF1345 domain-containing protein [Sphingomonas sp. 1P06PA]|uniref:DUF1345 domain-containing protein n=1 Tax=Sphingomonas sp. 1P06PA TaxID=554121 RepID=UPI0039A773D0
MAASASIGNRLAPTRFILFGLVFATAAPVAGHWIGWRQGVMAGFDLAALIFLAGCLPLLSAEVAAMRTIAERNDANRAGLLAITGAVMLVILVAVADELAQGRGPAPPVAALIVATLAIAWLFSNMVYALHYAHLFYVQRDGRDAGGLDVPDRAEPDYWDFVYFAFTLGMTFQTSDVTIRSTAVRRVVTAHSVLAFGFNIGVLAFTINVLGS